MNKPLIIYVSGAPGSGKTTLAAQIADSFQLLRISNDIINGGLRLTEGKPSDRKRAFDEIFIPSLIALAEKKVSLVVDQVLQKDMSEHGVIDKLTPFANIIYIHTQSEHSIDRYIEREVNRTDKARYQTNEEVEERGTFHRANLERTQQPLELEVPTLVVNTDNGYEPSIEYIFDFIENTYRNGEA